MRYEKDSLEILDFAGAGGTRLPNSLAACAMTENGILGAGTPGLEAVASVHGGERMQKVIFLWFCSLLEASNWFHQFYMIWKTQ